MALGLVAASKLAGLPLFLGAYPITPASEILEQLARLQALRRPRPSRPRTRSRPPARRSAPRSAARSASTTSAGPGIVLKSETIGLAIMLELPLVILDVQRAGPVDRDADQARAGRPADGAVRPQRRVAGAGGRRLDPGECFDAAIEAARIALKYRTPVYLLSDAYLANGSEPWLLPDVASLPDISPEFTTEPNSDDGFLPYLRDPETLARPWAVPGTPGLEHRIGGLEKADVTGNISYDPDNHDLMMRLRAPEGRRDRGRHPRARGRRPGRRDLLVLGWGGTYGPIAAAVRKVRKAGGKVAHAHLRYLNPFPRNTGEVLRSYERVLVPEMNLGQLLKLVRAEFLVDAVGYNRVSGSPFKSAEIADAIETLVIE